jgi:tRNA (adenine22-N1)-methyltransferase
MNSQTAVKLGRRLRQLDTMLEQQYSIIWDCCCDHGLLGMSLLQRKFAEKVVFVDILSPQMALLEQDLQERFSADDFNWQVICQDVKDLDVPEVESQLFIIAGVGGNKTIQFIESLCAAMPGLPFDLLLCSVHGNYAVRKALIEHGFGLKQEQIILENNRFYEAIYVSQNSTQPIVATGSSMWDELDSDHQKYWQKTLAHYRKKASADPAKFAVVVEDYEGLFTIGSPQPNVSIGLRGSR